jgi:hypothetical protein
MKALRPPPAASPVAYLVRFRCPRESSWFVLAGPSAPERVEAHAGPGSLFSRRSRLPARSHVDVSGTSQVSRRPLQCLCPVPGPRPNQRGLANTVSSVLPLLQTKQRLQRATISRLPRGFGTYCLRFMGDVATAHARLASGWLARLYREGVEPSGSQLKGFRAATSLPPFLVLS